MWISWRLLRHAQSDCCQLAFLAGRSRRHGKLDVESICKTSLSSISATWFLIITSCANLVPFLVDLGYINRRFFWAGASNDWPCSAAARNLQSRKWWAKWHMAKQNGGGHLVQHPFLWLFLYYFISWSKWTPLWLNQNSIQMAKFWCSILLQSCKSCFVD